MNLDAYRPLPQNRYCNHKLFFTTVFAPVYIDMTANTNHFSTPNLHIAHLITSFRTLSKAFSKFTKQNRASFLQI